jgi:hypothetical protein
MASPVSGSPPKVHHRLKHHAVQDKPATAATKTDHAGQQWNLAGTRPPRAARPAASSGHAPPATTAAAATAGAVSGSKDSPDKLRASARALATLPAGGAREDGLQQLMSRATSLYNGMSPAQQKKLPLGDFRKEVTGLTEWSPSAPREFKASYPLENKEAAQQIMKDFQNSSGWLSVPGMTASPLKGTEDQRDIRILDAQGKPGGPIIERRTSPDEKDPNFDPNFQSYAIDHAPGSLAQNYKSDWRIEDGPDGKPVLNVTASWQDPKEAGHKESPDAYQFTVFNGILGNVFSNAAASMNRASRGPEN